MNTALPPSATTASPKLSLGLALLVFIVAATLP